MKKMLFALAAVAALMSMAGSASAQAPAAPAPAGPAPANCPPNGGQTSGGYGVPGIGAPFGLLHGIFCNHGGRGGNRNVNTLPVATGGTLVFPQNPFIRSPRDYFMWDER